jgi:chromosomal replication initiator protein
MTTMAMTSRNDDFFSVFKQILQSRFGDAAYKSYFFDLELTESADDSVTLSTESDIRKELIDQRFKAGMIEAWSEYLYPIRRMTIVRRRALSAAAARVDANAPIPRVRQGALFSGAAAPASSPRADGARLSPRRSLTIEDLATPLDPRATFDTFAVDETNQIAFAAAQRVLSDTAPREILYVFGEPGVGKTHLIQACGHAWMSRRPGARCIYLTHNQLQTGCVDAALSNSAGAFIRDMVANDLVIIDDIHLLAGSNRTLKEASNIVNALCGLGRQIIIAGAQTPTRLADAGVHDRLADRLAGGFAVPVERGSEALRREVLKKRRDAAVLSNEPMVSDEAIDFVARHFTGTMRECIGAFNQLLLLNQGAAEPISAEEAQKALRARLGERRRSATLEDALKAAADVFGITVEDLRGRAQPQRIVRARHAYVMVGRQVLNESFPRIARAMNRDHTTAISSIRRGEALFERDKKFQAQIAEIKAALGA